MKTTPCRAQTGGRRFSSTTHPLISAIAAAFALLLFSGLTARCADYKPESAPAPNAPAPGRRIGLVYAGSLPGFDLQIPDTKYEAAEDYGVRLGFSWARDLHEDLVRNEVEALGIYIRMALTPVGMLAGGTYGAAAGASAGKLKPALTAITNAMAELQVEEALRRQLLLLIREKSPQPVVLLTNPFPAETAFRAPTLMDAYAPLPFSFADRQQEKECGPLPDDGLETLLLVRVVNHGLSGRDGPNSPLSLNMAVRVTLIQVQDHTQMSGFYAQYDSPARKFVDWGSNDAQPFRAEFERALQNLAMHIAAESGPRLPPAPQPIRLVEARTK